MLFMYVCERLRVCMRVFFDVTSVIDILPFHGYRKGIPSYCP